MLSPFPDSQAGFRRLHGAAIQTVVRGRDPMGVCHGPTAGISACQPHMKVRMDCYITSPDGTPAGRSQYWIVKLYGSSNGGGGTGGGEC